MSEFFKKWRVLVILIPCIALFFVIYSKYVKLAFAPQKPISPSRVQVERGSIVDRNGRPLAVQTNFYHFVVTPKMVKNPKEFASKVAPTLDADPETILQRINDAMDSPFLYIKKKISQDQYNELTAIISENNYANFTRFDRIPGRIYPENRLASQLVGYMGDDGKGLSGIEYSQDSVLAPESEPGATGTVHGKNVYLTIDAGLQYKLEKIAQDALESTQAESIMMIASNSRNGEVLSYISLPSANLNEYSSASNFEKQDRPSVTAYEPGSVFKIFTVASFLDASGVTPDDAFLCDGLYQRKTNLGETIKIKCLEHHGWVNARKALNLSCNDSIAQMSEHIETETFLAYLRKFGFGERTGVELPSETRGILKNPSDKYWSGRTKPTLAIGQEISVSALQMVQAATAIANKGVVVKPTFIQRITDVDGKVQYEHETIYGNKVLRKATAEYLLSCMETTTKEGNARRAHLSDISIGTKTGTAQMADTVHGGYSDTDFLSSCIAIFPVEDPQIVLYIVIEKAKGETYGGRIAAPVIKDAANEIIDHLGISREGAASLEHSGRITIKENAPVLVKERVPDFTGKAKRDLLPLLEREDIQFHIIGEGWVTQQDPEPGTPITENMTIELVLESID